MSLEEKNMKSNLLALYLIIALIFPIQALALPGDWAQYKGDGTSTVDLNVSSWTGLDFQTVNHEDSIYTQAGDDISVDVGEDGLYLICYNLYSSNTTFNDRMAFVFRLYNNGTASALPGGGRVSTYARNSANYYVIGQACAISEVSAGDDIEAQVIKDTTNSGSYVINNSIPHFQFLQLDDYWEWISLTSSAGQSVSTSMADVQWNTLVDSNNSNGTFTHSTSTNNHNITLEEAGQYLVLHQVYSNGGDTNRSSISSRIEIDGSDVPQSNDYAFVRNAAGIDIGITNNLSLINAGAGDVLNVEFGALDADFSGSQTLDPLTSLVIVKLPDSSDYLRLTDPTDESFTIGGTGKQFGLKIVPQQGNDSFSHDGTAEETTIQKDGLYLFTFGGRVQKKSLSGTARLQRRIGWYYNGGVEWQGADGFYLRGANSSQDTFAAGFSMSSLIDASASDTLRLIMFDVNTDDGDGTDALLANEYGVSAANVDTWFEVSVSTTGTQTSTSDISSTNNDSGAAFVIVDETGHREVTGITVTESGTIDAQNDLDNIELYYELDTSAPYDCASESYDGGETQYGSTDTDGFSGANGTSTFTGSVTINTESSMCVYVVYDVGAGAAEDETIEFSIDSPDTDVTVGNGTIITTSTVAMSGTTTVTAASGTLTVDIVDSGGTTVGSPTMAMNPIDFSFASQTATGTFSTSSEKIRVDNATGTATWTLSLAASATTDVWDSAGTDYDFNDPTASAADGGDADSVGGQMTIDPSSITITPEGGCTSTNISAGSSDSFSEGITDTITIASAASGADTGCYWDITGIDVSQTIPAEQPAASDYNIDMVLSIIAS